MPITRIYHGDINPSDIARDLIAYYHRGAYQVQQIGATRKSPANRHSPISAFRRQTALTITIHRVDDGISVQVGKQAWMGVAASG